MKNGDSSTLSNPVLKMFVFVLFGFTSSDSWLELEDFNSVYCQGKFDNFRLKASIQKFLHDPEKM